MRSITETKLFQRQELVPVVLRTTAMQGAYTYV